MGDRDVQMSTFYFETKLSKTETDGTKLNLLHSHVTKNDVFNSNWNIKLRGFLLIHSFELNQRVSENVVKVFLTHL